MTLEVAVRQWRDTVSIKSVSLEFYPWRQLQLRHTWNLWKALRNTHTLVSFSLRTSDMGLIGQSHQSLVEGPTRWLSTKRLLLCKFHDLNSALRIHEKMEAENRFHKVVLWPPWLVPHYQNDDDDDNGSDMIIITKINQKGLLNGSSVKGNLTSVPETLTVEEPTLESCPLISTPKLRHSVLAFFLLPFSLLSSSPPH